MKSFVSYLLQTDGLGWWFPPGTPVSSTRKLISSSFHRLDMTLAVAEALNPNKPNPPKRWFPPGSPVSSTRKLISSSSFHCLDMTLAVAEGLTPNKTKQKHTVYTDHKGLFCKTDWLFFYLTVHRDYKGLYSIKHGLDCLVSSHCEDGLCCQHSVKPPLTHSILQCTGTIKAWFITEELAYIDVLSTGPVILCTGT